MSATTREQPLDAVRARLLEPILVEALFDGFTEDAISAAAGATGETPAASLAAFPDGPASVIAYWSTCADAAAVAVLATDEAATWRIREKVAQTIEARLAYLAPHKEAARRAAGTLALPALAPLGIRLTYRTADAIWRGLGDASTDFNFYSKRAILSGVLTTTTARWFADDDAEYAATRSFLADRIENVMAFEKFKGRVSKYAPDPARVVEALARARYPFR